MANLEELVSNLSNLTLQEAAELSKRLEKHWGVSAQAPTVIQAPSTGPVESQVVPEQTEFSLVLLGHGPKKIEVIKIIRGITGLGLKEAKDLVEAAPKSIKEGLDKQEADRLATQLKEAGATVELK